LDERAYAFLLGMYLGDGSIARHPRTYKLRIVQDARYLNSIKEIRRTMAAVRDCDVDRVRTVDHEGCVEVYAYWGIGHACSPNMARGGSISAGSVSRRGKRGSLPTNRSNSCAG
jgi:hypothetical protein